MHSRLSFLSITLAILAIPAAAQLKIEQPVIFTIQVASFPDASQAEKFASQLIQVGEKPLSSTVGIEGRGLWTRIFLGIFDTPQAARRYGDSLISRAIIKEYFVKRADYSLDLTRPRRVILDNLKVKSNKTDNTKAENVSLPEARRILCLPSFRFLQARKGSSRGERGMASFIGQCEHDEVSLPVVPSSTLSLVRAVDTSLIPRPNPIDLALKLVTAEQQGWSAASGERRGLWLSGDIAEGLDRLKWIVGAQNAELVNVDPDGHVTLDKKLLAVAARLPENDVENPLRALDYITSNEGLLLLVQVSQGPYAYLLHIGKLAPTGGKPVETTGSINLDNNVDSRINPYRKNGQKLNEERPPQGFDSLIGLNPVARWFNLTTNSWVQCGEIVFHELAEAHAKLEYGLDYLDHGLRPGAHATALQREARLKAQRPEADIIITIGANRLLRTEEEIRLFYAEGTGGNQR